MSRRARAAAVVVTASLALLGCGAPAPDPVPETRTVGPTVEPDRTVPPSPEVPSLGTYGVNAGDPAAVDVAMDVLAEGGTAVDAAVAAAFAVSVVEPFASGVGGGGSAIVVPAGGAPEWHDYREVVPAGGVPGSDAGVPGFVVGLAHLHAEHGRLPWERLVEPAVELARDGYPATQMLADQVRSTRGRSAASGLAQFFPGGAPVDVGDVVVQADLAATLQAIADGGAAEMVSGGVGRSLAEQVRGIDVASLEDYRVQRGTPPSGEFAGLEVVSAAPALPGVALIQMLQVAEALGVGESEPGGASYMHRMARAWSLAAATVEEHLGDPDFVDVPVAEITDADRNAEQALSLVEGTARTSDRRGAKEGETTHISVVDADGTVVSMTNTLTNFWGSGLYVDGYFMNNQMVRFSVGAGGQNSPEPGRRSVSWGMPTVVLDAQGRPVLVVGSPGGQRIPMILGDVLARWALHDQSLADAVAAPRFYAAGGEMELEDLPRGAVVDELRALGYATEGPMPRYFYMFGSVNALAVDWESGTVTGAADQRREAAVAVADAVDSGR